MKQFEIQGKTGHSRIIVGECLKHISDYLPDRQVIVITDEVVSNLYEKDFPRAPVIKGMLIFVFTFFPNSVSRPTFGNIQSSWLVVSPGATPLAPYA